MTRIAECARIAVVTVLLFHRGLAAANTVLPSEWIDQFGALSRLSASCGLVLPSVSLPYSRSYLSQTIGSLVMMPADPGVQAEVASLARMLRDSDVPLIGISLRLEYEHYFRPSDQPLSSSSFRDLLETIEPLGFTRFSYQWNNSIVLTIAAVQQREYNSGTFAGNFPLPVPANPIAIENNFLREGYLQASSGPFELTFGRQRAHIGPSPVNSLMVSQRIPFLDGLSVKGHLGPLSLTLLISTLDNRRATPDVTPDGSTYDFGKTVILFNTHYFELDFGALRLGVGGQYLAVRPQNAFSVADFFPVFSWHQTGLTPSNLSLIADFSVAPFRGLTVYGQGGLDDFNLAFAGISDAAVPTIPAFLIGVTWQGRLDRFLLNAWMEAGCTHYLWGSFDDSVAMARAIYRMEIDGDNRAIPLTSPFGPGSIWAVASCAVSTPWRIDAGVRIQYVGVNPLANLTDAPYATDSAVGSAPLEHWLQCALKFRVSPLDHIRLSVTPEVGVVTGRSWFGLTLGGEVLFEKEVILAAARRPNPHDN